MFLQGNSETIARQKPSFKIGSREITNYFDIKRQTKRRKAKPREFTVCSLTENTEYITIEESGFVP